jgi:hypothetical protein
VSNLLKCDKCGKTAETKQVAAHRMPLGWSSVAITIKEEFTPFWSETIEDAKSEPPVGVPVSSSIDLCPDCTDTFVEATGCKDKIRREPEPRDGMPTLY